MAARFLTRQRPDHTLQPTALVHEAFVRLIKVDSSTTIQGADLVRLATKAMRSVLVDHARAKSARKRSAEGGRVPLESVADAYTDYEVDLLAVDEALERLSRLEPQWRLIVELRFFGGCREEEIAALLGLTTRTVQRQWRMAKAWLRTEIKGACGDGL